jgi:hypothetical protein
LTNGLDDTKIRGRHLVFDSDSEGEIMEWIEAQAEKYQSITRTDIRHDCKVKYSRSISRG